MIKVAQSQQVVKSTCLQVDNPLPQDHRFYRECLRETWARFIEWAISRKNEDRWFCTFTFKKDEGRESAWRKMNAWFNNLQMAYFHFSGGRRLRSIVVEEWQKREVIHFHALVMGERLNELSRKRWESRWNTLSWNCGFATIVNSDVNCAPYLAKYVHKVGDVTLVGYWQALHCPKSVSCCKGYPRLSAWTSTARHHGK